MSSIRVEALKKGYYGMKLREPGEQFDVVTIVTTTKNSAGEIVPLTMTAEEQFSKKWMKKVDATAQAKREEDDASTKHTKSGKRVSDQSKI